MEITDDRFKVYDAVNFAAIEAKSKELEKYPGEIPWICYSVRIGLYYYHVMFLDDIGLMDDDLAWKFSKRRKKSYTPDEEVDELRIWIKDNPEFKDFLIEE